MKRDSVGKLLALEIRDDVVAAVGEKARKGADGLTIKEVAALFGLEYHHAYTAAAELVAMKALTWAHRADRTVCRLPLPDWRPPEKLDLTAKQRAALDYLVSAAGGERAVRASFRDITKGAGLSGGGIVVLLDALDRKGYIRIAERGRGTRKTLFEVYPQGDGPRGYSPMRPPTRSPTSESPAALPS